MKEHEYSLLDEELQFFKQITNTIVNNLYKYINKNKDNLPKIITLKDISAKLITTHILFLVKKYFPKDLSQIYEWSYGACVVEHLIKNIYLQENPEDNKSHFVTFPVLVSNNKSTQEYHIDIQKKEEIRDELENLFHTRFLIIFNSIKDAYPKWNDWREENLKFKNIRQKLPELKGIF